jgi:Putative peptidoglycan binding domain
MRVLELGISGEDVRQWQSFLFGFGFKSTIISGTFDAATNAATKDFQRNANLKDDGAVGPNTIAAAVQRGFPAVVPAFYPKRPAFAYPNGARNVRRVQIRDSRQRCDPHHRQLGESEHH